MTEIAHQRSPEVLYVRIGDVPIALPNIASRLSDGSSLIAPLVEVWTAIDAAMGTLDDALSENPAINRTEFYKRRLLSAVTPLLKKLLAATRTKDEGCRAFRADLFKPKPDASRALIVTSLLKGRAPTDIVLMALVDVEVARVALDNFDLLQLPAVAREQIEQAVMRMSLTAYHAARLTLTPTLNDMLAHGPDMEAAKRAASESLNDLAAAEEEAETVALWLREAISMVAALAGSHVGAVWQSVRA